MVEEKEKISVSEFKAWLVGLIRGKKGELPDFDDWKQIKQMIDKMEADVVYLTQEPQPVPYFPTQREWWTSPTIVSDPVGAADAPHWATHWTITGGTTTEKSMLGGSLDSGGFSGTYTIENTTSPGSKSLIKLFDSWMTQEPSQIAHTKDKV